MNVTGYVTGEQAEVLVALGEEVERAREAAEAERRRAEAERKKAEAERVRREAEAERRRVEAERKRAEAEHRRAGRVFRDCEGSWCPELVVVPAGTYRMGSPSSESGRNEDEGPVHEVTIGEPIAVGVYEVMVGEWRRFVDETGHSTSDSCWIRESGEWKERGGRSWRNPGYEQGWGHPVVCVSWGDAKAYVEWLSRETGEEYRLLTESEWEYVARGGTRMSRYWGGSGSSHQCRHANGADRAWKRRYSDWKRAVVASCDDGHVGTSPVGSYEANGYGLHDVSGNVWEWVEDCWRGNYRGSPRDGSAWEGGDCSRRVLRGGSWNDDPRWLRSAVRDRVATDIRSYTLGFRVARTLVP